MEHALSFLSALLVLFVVGAHAQDPVSLTGYTVSTQTVEDARNRLTK